MPLVVCNARASFLSLRGKARIPHGSNTMLVIGWISQIVGIWGRRSAGPGLEPELASSPEAARRFVVEEITRWTPIVREVELKTK